MILALTFITGTLVGAIALLAFVRWLIVSHERDLARMKRKGI